MLGILWALCRLLVRVVCEFVWVDCGLSGGVLELIWLSVAGSCLLGWFDCLL